MKRLFALPLLATLMQQAGAQIPYIDASQLRHHWGFVRKSPCATGNADNCGSNPPTWHLTPEWCGTVISTSAFRNADGTASTNGARVTLPTGDEFATWGYTASGAEGNTGTENREGQCEISFVMGLPLPGNFLRLGLDGVQGPDKVTFLAEGVGHDLFSGDVVVPAVAGTVTVAWNGVSWLPKAATPTYAEKLGAGQMSSQGQGRLIPVTADPTWWTVGSKIGSLAYCPKDGLGTVTDSNGTTQLVQQPINCAFMDVPVGTANDWIGLRSIVSLSVPDAGQIAQGAAYGAGTAPNGTAYAAGNYVVVPVTSAVSLVSGSTVNIHNLPTTLGGRNYLQGKWIIKLLVSGDPGCTVTNCIELHERVNDFNAQSLSAVGPPSAFVVGDTIDHTIVDNDPATAHVIGGYLGLANTSGATARYTDPAHGTERESTNKIRAIVGFARHVSGSGYQDTLTNRLVASYFNPTQKECTTTTASDRTTASLTFANLHATDATCNFVYLKHTSAQAVSLGDVGRGVRWSVTMTLANNTASDGCEVGIAFDGGTAETAVARMMNGAAVQGAVSITASGLKTGLSEGNHTAIPQFRAVTGGTCTATAAATRMSLILWQ